MTKTKKELREKVRKFLVEVYEVVDTFTIERDAKNDADRLMIMFEKALKAKEKKLLPDKASFAKWLFGPGTSEDYLNGLVKGWNDCREVMKERIDEHEKKETIRTIKKGKKVKASDVSY